MVKVLAGNKCECNAPQRAVEKEKGEKVSQFVIIEFIIMVK